VAAASAGEFAGRRHSGNAGRMPAPEIFADNLIPNPVQKLRKSFSKPLKTGNTAFGFFLAFFAPA
jgi:hypothetical protein